jgi:hypothetical protein
MQGEPSSWKIRTHSNQGCSEGPMKRVRNPCDAQMAEFLMDAGAHSASWSDVVAKTRRVVR